MPRTPFRRLIVADIVSKIETGEYRPGQRLPSQARLAAAYGCSLQPVKAAIDELEIRGYVVSYQGKATLVAEHPPGPDV